MRKARAKCANAHLRTHFTPLKGYSKVRAQVRTSKSVQFEIWKDKSMKREDAEEYTQSLGQIVSGAWRQIALATRLGVPKALGMSTSQWVNDHLGGYVKLNREERRLAITELRENGHSQREVADILGVNQATISLDENSSKKLENTAQNDENSSPAPLDAMAALAVDGAAKPNGPTHRTSYAGKDDWGTPAEYIALARKAMGDIDLDPATHEAAQKIIRAAAHMTVDDDALSLKWHGRVWLNPPYSQPLIGKFIEKLIAELECGNASEAILLVNNSSDTAWFQRAASFSSSICFTKGRISFLGSDGPGLSPVQGQTFMYFGENYRRFESVFNGVGFTCCVTQSNSSEAEPGNSE